MKLWPVLLAILVLLVLVLIVPMIAGYVEEVTSALP